LISALPEIEQSIEWMSIDFSKLNRSKQFELMLTNFCWLLEQRGRGFALEEVRDLEA